MFYFISLHKATERSAAAKAPNDIYTLCERRGWKELFYPVGKKGKSRYLWRLRRGFMVLLFWIHAFFIIRKGDVVFYQHPARYGSKIACRFIRILQRRRAHFVVLVHDLDSLRYQLMYDDSSKTNVQYEDKELLSQFDAIICHNKHMKAYLMNSGIAEKKIICLQLFDYLISDQEATSKQSFEGIVIAGNLNRKKCGYVYALGQIHSSCPLHLYGINYDETEASETIIYHGSFEPDALPGIIQGKFGIVWDGNSIDTCEGATGNYLRYNNPHKLSLYMAAGIPVITWKEAAIADFVVENGVGLTVRSLREIPEKMKEVTEEEYAQMKANVEIIRERVISGYYFDHAIGEAQRLLGIEEAK